MYVNFNVEKLKEVALNKKEANYENNLSPASAFCLVLDGVDYELVDNLCEEIGTRVGNSPKEIYNMLQDDRSDDEFKKLVLNTAYDLLDFGKTIGNKMSGSFNTSAWIAHLLYVGRVSSVLARNMGLDEEVAMKLGILHDIGRKFDHSFRHTVKGYEYLCGLGYMDVAICCLTHSFLPVHNGNVIKGNRCANCEPSIDGFYVDENGNGVFEAGSKKDDITLFLEQYNYNLYDIILNMADLMAMSTGITSPYDRMLDIYTRKKIDVRNNSFFKVCFVNLMRYLLYNLTDDEKYKELYNIININSLDNLLIETSNEFMNEYNKLVDAKVYSI